MEEEVEGIVFEESAVPFDSDSDRDIDTNTTKGKNSMISRSTSGCDAVMASAFEDDSQSVLEKARWCDRLLPKENRLCTLCGKCVTRITPQGQRHTATTHDALGVILCQSCYRRWLRTPATPDCCVWCRSINDEDSTVSNLYTCTNVLKQSQSQLAATPTASSDTISCAKTVCSACLDRNGMLPLQDGHDAAGEPTWVCMLCQPSPRFKSLQRRATIMHDLQVAYNAAKEYLTTFRTTANNTPTAADSPIMADVVDEAADEADEADAGQTMKSNVSEVDMDIRPDNSSADEEVVANDQTDNANSRLDKMDQEASMGERLRSRDLHVRQQNPGQEDGNDGAGAVTQSEGEASQTLQGEAMPSLSDGQVPDTIIGQQLPTFVKQCNRICAVCSQKFSGKWLPLVHPDLSIAVCLRCEPGIREYPVQYGVDGSAEACLCCHDGGELIVCSACPNAVCYDCVARLTDERRANVAKNMPEWKCFRCRTLAILPFIQACVEIMKRLPVVLRNAPVEKLEFNPKLTAMLPRYQKAISRRLRQLISEHYDPEGIGLIHSVKIKAGDLEQHVAVADKMAKKTSKSLSSKHVSRTSTQKKTGQLTDPRTSTSHSSETPRSRSHSAEDMSDAVTHVLPKEDADYDVDDYLTGDESERSDTELLSSSTLHSMRAKRRASSRSAQGAKAAKKASVPKTKDSSGSVLATRKASTSQNQRKSKQPLMSKPTKVQASTHETGTPSAMYQELLQAQHAVVEQQQFDHDLELAMVLSERFDGVDDLEHDASYIPRSSGEVNSVHLALTSATKHMGKVKRRSGVLVHNTSEQDDPSFDPSFDPAHAAETSESVSMEPDLGSDAIEEVGEDGEQAGVKPSTGVLASGIVPKYRVCTVCNQQFSDLWLPLVHPQLPIAVCLRCEPGIRDYPVQYDEDGTAAACLCCHDGGELIVCSTCPDVICFECIARLLGDMQAQSARGNTQWKCFKCDPLKLRKYSAACFEIMKRLPEPIRNASIKSLPFSQRFSTMLPAYEQEPSPKLIRLLERYYSPGALGLVGFKPPEACKYGTHYRCDVPDCTFTTKKLNSFESHRMDEHQVPPFFKASCSHCDLLFPTVRHVREHEPNCPSLLRRWLSADARRSVLEMFPEWSPDPNTVYLGDPNCKSINQKRLELQPRRAGITAVRRIQRIMWACNSLEVESAAASQWRAAITAKLGLSETETRKLVESLSTHPELYFASLPYSSDSEADDDPMNSSEQAKRFEVESTMRASHVDEGEAAPTQAQQTDEINAGIDSMMSTADVEEYQHDAMVEEMDSLARAPEVPSALPSEHTPLSTTLECDTLEAQASADKIARRIYNGTAGHRQIRIKGGTGQYASELAWSSSDESVNDTSAKQERPVRRRTGLDDAKGAHAMSLLDSSEDDAHTGKAKGGALVDTGEDSDLSSAIEMQETTAAKQRRKRRGMRRQPRQEGDKHDVEEVAGATGHSTTAVFSRSGKPQRRTRAVRNSLQGGSDGFDEAEGAVRHNSVLNHDELVDSDLVEDDLVDDSTSKESVSQRTTKRAAALKPKKFQLSRRAKSTQLPAGIEFADPVQDTQENGSCGLATKFFPTNILSSVKPSSPVRDGAELDVSFESGSKLEQIGDEEVAPHQSFDVDVTSCHFELSIVNLAATVISFAVSMPLEDVTFLAAVCAVIDPETRQEQAFVKLWKQTASHCQLTFVIPSPSVKELLIEDASDFSPVLSFGPCTDKTQELLACCLSPFDVKLYVADSQVRATGVKALQPVLSLASGPSPVTSLTWHDATLFVGDSLGCVSTYSLTSSTFKASFRKRGFVVQPESIMSCHDGEAVEHMCVSPDSKHLLCTSTRNGLMVMDMGTAPATQLVSSMFGGLLSTPHAVCWPRSAPGPVFANLDGTINVLELSLEKKQSPSSASTTGIDAKVKCIGYVQGNVSALAFDETLSVLVIATSDGQVSSVPLPTSRKYWTSSILQILELPLLRLDMPEALRLLLTFDLPSGLLLSPSQGVLSKDNPETGADQPQDAPFSMFKLCTNKGTVYIANTVCDWLVKVDTNLAFQKHISTFSS
eukprot:m.252161 g.252161  ORF g.252161 m.252161 type:complete len:2059 (-) comp15468_c1_seq1:318-6494(-)